MIFDPAAPDPSPPASTEVWALVVRGEPHNVKRWFKCGLRGFNVRVHSAAATTLPEQVKRLQGEVLMLRAEVERLEARLAANRRERCRITNPLAAPIAGLAGDRGS